MFQFIQVNPRLIETDMEEEKEEPTERRPAPKRRPTKRQQVDCADALPPEVTPVETAAEEAWVEEQYRKHCPWHIKLMKWMRSNVCF